MEMTQRIRKRYHDEDNVKTISVGEAIKDLEIAGYYKPGSVKLWMNELAANRMKNFTVSTIAATFYFVQ